MEFVRLVQAFYTNSFRLHELVIVYLLVVTVLIIVIILRSHFNEASCQSGQDYCGAPNQLDSWERVAEEENVGEDGVNNRQVSDHADYGRARRLEGDAHGYERHAVAERARRQQTILLRREHLHCKLLRVAALCWKLHQGLSEEHEADEDDSLGRLVQHQLGEVHALQAATDDADSREEPRVAETQEDAEP